ncbi:MAG: hemolysin family protein [Actinomycetota bacterium]|nr:hemolysin family protein [Actinomycetota bacterium]MDI6821458.1 hemolysin family protein [Actinomycetota bacterium]
MESSILSLIGFLTLLVLSAFSSAAETALTSVNRIKVKHMVEEKVSGAAILEALLEHPARFLATILLLNNLVNIGAASLAAVTAANLGLSYPAVISTGVVTFLVLVYGEITPKTFSAQNAERIALLVARPISLLCIVLFPIARLFIFIANMFIRLFGGKTMKEGPFITEEELKTMVSVGEKEGVIEEQEKEMIHSVFEFGDTVVREVMVPRMDMVCVDSNASSEEVLALFAKEKHSRIPVYEDTVDNIIGIIYSKDLLTQVAKGNAKIPLKKLVRPVHYIPETKKVSELLRELQRKRQHMAIVVDEYGGTAGLVTIEDLLEEIVGEIYDEYDLEKVMIERIDDNNIRVDARVNLDEVNEILGTNLPDFECDTIGGFVYNLVGKIPSEREKVDFEGLTFTVEKVVGRRISKILITKNPDKLENQSK